MVDKKYTKAERLDMIEHTLTVYVTSAQTEIFFLKSPTQLERLDKFFQEMLKHPDSREGMYVVLSRTLMTMLYMKVDGMPMSDCIRTYYGNQAMHVIEVCLTYYTN